MKVSFLWNLCVGVFMSFEDILVPVINPFCPTVVVFIKTVVVLYAAVH